MARPFKLTVAIISETPGPDGQLLVQQEVPVQEYSDNAQEHVKKNFHIARAVVFATIEALEELAKSDGFETEVKKGTAQAVK